MHEKWMRLALLQAQMAQEKGEIPVGAVITRGDALLAACHNLTQTASDPLAHAELLALRRAAQKKGDWRFNDCTLYVTLEPCPMCAGALVMARMNTIVFGAYDERQGCCGSVYLLPMDKALNANALCLGGVLENECKALLSAFFKDKR